MYCNKCGRENPDDAVFCHQCGADIGSVSHSGARAASETTSSDSGKSATFQITSAFRNAIDLVKSPVSFISANRDNDPTLSSLMINYVAPLAAIPFIATLIGDAWWYGLFFGFGGIGLGYSFVLAVVTYILDIVAVFVVGFVIWKLAPNFSSTSTQVRATRMAAYAFTPAFLLAVLDLIPPIAFLTIFGTLYGLYILYLGLPILTGTPKDKALTYVVVIVIATIIVYVIIGAIVAIVAAAVFATALGVFI